MSIRTNFLYAQFSEKISRCIVGHIILIIFFCISSSIIFTGCIPGCVRLGSEVIKAIVINVVVENINPLLETVLFDFLKGTPPKKIGAIKKAIRPGMESIVETTIIEIISQEGADSCLFLSKENCQGRTALMAEYHFNRYATRFVSTFKGCRNNIVLNPQFSNLEYVKQVDLITRCIANEGFQREIALIMEKIQ